jgi:transcriptional regulator with XRE-family HTH domain
VQVLAGAAQGGAGAARRLAASPEKLPDRAVQPDRDALDAFIRRDRVAREIGLREMVKMIGVSPTYLSTVELDEFPPPAEDKVKAIAKIIQCDADDLLARASVHGYLGHHQVPPVELVALLRTTKGLTAADDSVLDDFAWPLAERAANRPPT